MSPTQLGQGVLAWADDVEENTLAQVRNSSNLPFVNHPVALMADAHLGYGVPIGTVLATRGAIIPSAVGVDIGCGMAAQRLPWKIDQLDLDKLHDRISQVIPSGQPTKGNKGNGQGAEDRVFLPDHEAMLWDARLHSDHDMVQRAYQQFGTLGGGNHFVEVCADETDQAWIVLHSGSRGVGNKIAQHHIANAKGLMEQYFIELADPDLAYLVEGTEDFRRYIEAMLWAQDYAAGSRVEMMRQAVDAAYLSQSDDPLFRPEDLEPVINCHHNYTCKEHHHGKNMWVTRKGAIDASKGQLGIIPGSMATGSYIVEGLGNPASYESASHGAGRVMSRTQARKTLSEEDLTERMSGIAWNNTPGKLLDEHPSAYKDLEHVMDLQDELVSRKHKLRTVLNYKGA